MRSIPRLSVILIALLLTLSIAVSALRNAQTAPSDTNLDASGWTIFTSNAKSRTVYVSSSTGSDTKHGLSVGAPVASIAKGVSLLRQGSADWLLLKRGDTWMDQQFGILPVHGRSATEPILISSYGTGARPLIETSGSLAIGTQGNNQNGDFVALNGIEFYAHTRDPNNPSFSFAGLKRQQAGFQFLNRINWFLMEDCKFSFYDGNNIQYPDVATGGMSNNVILRRNVIADSYNITGHSEGLYVDNVANLVLEQNLFDHNGWNSSVPGAAPNVFNHNIYIQFTSGPATLIGNILAQASSHGAQVRPGGIVIDNLFIRDPIELLIGGSASTVSGNVFTEGNDIDSANPRGYGIDVNPSSGPIQILRNVIAHEASGSHYGYGISFAAGTVGNTAKNNIIYRWDNPIVDKGVGNVTSPNSINLPGYPDPNRTVEIYSESLGGRPTLSDFLAEARKQSKDNWRPQYTANAANGYIRSGFGIEGPSTGAAPSLDPKN